MDKLSIGSTHGDILVVLNQLIERQNEVDEALINALSEEDVCTCGPEEACDNCPKECHDCHHCDLECYIFAGLDALVELAFEAPSGQVRLAAAEKLVSHLCYSD